MSSIGILLLSTILVLACTGCANTNVYAAEIVGNSSFEKDVDISTAVIDRTISIGDSAYDVKWSKSVQSELTDELYDIYEVVDSPDEFMPGKIKLNAKTGEVVRFSHINPFPDIENIDNLSDGELKSAVEQLIGDMVDFSQYNVFEVSRPTSSASEYNLWWQVKRDLLCNIALEIVISKDGAIETFSKTDACPGNLSRSFVSESERNKLLEDEICGYLGIKSLENVELEIISETLTYFHNESSVMYAVKIVRDGFTQVIMIRIS